MSVAAGEPRRVRRRGRGRRHGNGPPCAGALARAQGGANRAYSGGARRVALKDDPDGEPWALFFALTGGAEVPNSRIRFEAPAGTWQELRRGGVTRSNPGETGAVRRPVADWCRARDQDHQVPHSWTSPGAGTPAPPRRRQPGPRRCPADPPHPRPRYHADYVAAAPGSVVLGRADDFIPPGVEEEIEPVRHIGRSLLETGAMLAGLIACVATIALYMFFDRDIVSIVVAGLRASASSA